MHTRSVRVSNVFFEYVDARWIPISCSVVLGSPVLLCFDLEVLVVCTADSRQDVAGFFGISESGLPMIRIWTTHKTFRRKIANPVNYGNKYCQHFLGSLTPSLKNMCAQYKLWGIATSSMNFWTADDYNLDIEKFRDGFLNIVSCGTYSVPSIHPWRICVIYHIWGQHCYYIVFPYIVSIFPLLFHDRWL
jgi:hypothetical protein